jgi:ABC-2 type transport system ATP-binding protein
MAPQELGIYPTVTVRANLAFFGGILGLEKRRLVDRIEELASTLQLTKVLDRKAGTLSGGEKRRLHTAAALLHRPKLLLLDEPTVGVDVETRQQILHVVLQLAAEGTAVCYSTHYLSEIETLGARVVILHAGSVIAQGHIQDLIGSHARSAVRVTFDGLVPPLESTDVPSASVSLSGSELTMWTDQPGVALAALLAFLDGSSARLRSVEIVRPSLESVFLALTGSRYEENQV